MKPLRLVYHGTQLQAAQAILRTGFARGSYFTPYLDSALEMGGTYVFAVAKEDDGQLSWQFRTLRRVPARRIVSLHHYGEPEQMHHDEALGTKVFRSNMPKKKRLPMGGTVPPPRSI